MSHSGKWPDLVPERAWKRHRKSIGESVPNGWMRFGLATGSLGFSEALPLASQPCISLSWSQLPLQGPMSCLLSGAARGDPGGGSLEHCGPGHLLLPHTGYLGNVQGGARHSSLSRAQEFMGWEQQLSPIVIDPSLAPYLRGGEQCCLKKQHLCPGGRKHGTHQALCLQRIMLLWRNNPG